MSSSGTPALGPFRGLAPYDESSAALFYGRTEETSALYQLVTRTGTRVLAGYRGQVDLISLIRHSCVTNGRCENGASNDYGHALAGVRREF